MVLLFKLFSFFGFNTGYDINNYKLSISSNYNSGMERTYKDNYYIIKKPYIYYGYRKYIKRYVNKNKNVIIPIRDFKYQQNPV